MTTPTAPKPLDGEVDNILKRLKADLEVNRQKELEAKTLDEIRTLLTELVRNTAEIMRFVNLLKWWGPVLLAALLGSDTFSDVVRAFRLQGSVSQTPTHQQEPPEVPVSAVLPRDP